MKRKISKMMLTSAILGAVIALMPLDAVAKKPATELIVDCDSGDSLQAALDNTKLREPITLNVSGECSDGPFIIRQDVRVKGSPRAILSAPVDAYDVVRVVESANADLSDLTVVADGQGAVFGAVILVAESSSATIDHLVVGGSGRVAVRASDNSFVKIDDAHLTGSSTGAEVTGGSSAAISYSTFMHNSNGLIVGHFSTATLEGNGFLYNGSYGLWVSDNGSYGSVTTEGEPNFIGYNGMDVRCGPGGVFVADQPQLSDMPKVSIDADCRVSGFIF